MGRAVSRGLAQAGYGVAAFDLEPAPFSLDVGDLSAVKAAIKAVQPQVVVHGAALTTARQADGLDLLEVNVGGTLNLLEAVRPHPPQHLILLSSSGVYGPQPQGRPLVEQDSRDYPSPSAYGLSKRLAEQACRVAGLPQTTVWALRLAAVYGPQEQPSITRQQVSLVAQLVQGLYSRGPVALPRAAHDLYNFVHTSDLVRLINLIATQPAAGGFRLFNLGGPTRSALEIAQAVDQLLPQAGLLERIRWSSHPPIRHGAVDSSALAQQLGFVPQTPLATGLQDYLLVSREEISV